MSRIWRTIKGYIWWSYPRGSMHYDVMVTLILVFIFLALFSLSMAWVLKYTQEEPVANARAASSGTGR